MRLILFSLTLACGLWAQDPFQVKVTGHGRPVILIPGLSSSGETWDTTVARYQDRFQCHVSGFLMGSSIFIIRLRRRGRHEQLMPPTQAFLCVPCAARNQS
jgi:hypothetical protein